jgi:hypothetical protein
MKWTHVCAALLAISTSAVAVETPTANLDAAETAILQGDGARARQLLEALQVSQLSSKDQTQRACMVSRLQPNAASPAPANIAAPLVRDTLVIFQSYWHAALTQPDKREEAEAGLLAELQQRLNRPDLTTFDTVVEELSSQLEKAGVFFQIGGKTAQLYEFIIWNKQTIKEYDVALPFGRHKANVVLMDDIQSGGWARYATCGSIGTGGWTNEDSNSIFALVSEYDGIDSEDFKINLLVHESQHFSDYRRFRELSGADLEYRAKLAELSLANTVRVSTLNRFINDQGDDPDNPHSYANKRVLVALRVQMNLTPDADLRVANLARLRRASKALLRADNNMRARMARSAPKPSAP